jgi:hypothetical protein
MLHLWIDFYSVKKRLEKYGETLAFAKRKIKWAAGRQV